MKDGWFPFIQTIGSDFTEIVTAFLYKDNTKKYQCFIETFLSRYNKERLLTIQQEWWKCEPLKEKQQLLKSGVDSYLNGNYIGCIKTLYSEIEGIIRIQYVKEKAKDPSFRELQEFVELKARSKYDDPDSLGFPLIFMQYLNECIFQNFDLVTGDIPISRHSSGHGVADATLYTHEKALQAILTVDQIRFYLF